MGRMSSWVGSLVLAAAGFMTWAVYSLPLLTGRAAIREAWDDSYYWSVGLPVLVALLLIAGALTRVQPWLLAVAAVAGHFLGMLVIARPGTDLGLLPLTVLFIGAPMFLVFTGAAWVGGWVRELAAQTE